MNPPVGATPPAGSIVIGVDGSPWSERAIDWAIEQAEEEQRPLTLLHAVQPFSFPSAALMTNTTEGYTLLMDDARAAGHAILAAAHARVTNRQPTLDVHELLVFSDPRAALLDLADSAAMIVIGSRGRGPVASLLLGSVSVTVSKHASCPVVVMRPVAPERPRYGILVGVDGTEHSLPAIEFAYRTASFRGRPLTVLHCYWDAAAVTVDRTGTPPLDLGDEQALVAESLAGMQEKFPDVEVEVRLTHGFADQRLVVASRDYDLLVIGHHRISAIDDLVFGSVAPAVVEHAHGPVAVVPSIVSVPSEAPADGPGA